MSAVRLPDVLIDPRRPRLISSRNQHTGKVTHYPNWKRRIGLYLACSAFLGLVAVLVGGM